MATEVNLTPEQWRAAVEQHLADLGITWDQLADMSARRDFTTLEARKLWLATGGKRP